MLIAEIGNNHFGSIPRAMELIRIANESGADLIKGQAFKAADLKTGSMPLAFYEKCALHVDTYISLIDYARSLGNDLFFSIFSPGMERLREYQSWQKVTGAQTRDGKARLKSDAYNLVVSVPFGCNVPKFKKASVLFVGEYMADSPPLEYIDLLTEHLDRQAGYSDHSVGITNCLRARRFHGAGVIEKHFCLLKNESFGGMVFRDTVHGANPKELEQLARELSK